MSSNLGMRCQSTTEVLTFALCDVGRVRISTISGSLGCILLLRWTTSVSTIVLRWSLLLPYGILDELESRYLAGRPWPRLCSASEKVIFVNQKKEARSREVVKTSLMAWTGQGRTIVDAFEARGGLHMTPRDSARARNNQQPTAETINRDTDGFRVAEST